tara:strand:- start:4197 stop:4379 length:183 start_codon:yes stop_codon:yes gene_type:complete
MRDKVSKRILGFLSYVIGLGMAIISGLEFYNIDSNLVLFVLGNGSVLLGIDTWKSTKPTV